MTAQPDTAAIREDFDKPWWEPHAKRVVHALCDALDAARAKTFRTELRFLANFQRAEAAEARIAAALTLCDERDQPGIVDVDYDEQTDAIRRALTGEAP